MYHILNQPTLLPLHECELHLILIRTYLYAKAHDACIDVHVGSNIISLLIVAIALNIVSISFVCTIAELRLINVDCHLTVIDNHDEVGAWKICFEPLVSLKLDLVGVRTDPSRA